MVERGPHCSLGGESSREWKGSGKEGQGQAQPRPRRLQTRLHPHVTRGHPASSEPHLGAETWYPLGLLLEIQANARMSLELEVHRKEWRLTPPKAGSG